MHLGANLASLRDLGFDILTDSVESDPEKLRSAVARGALIMARLSGSTGADAPQRILEAINGYALRDSVAFWYLGDHLGKRRQTALREEELTNVRAAISAVRNLDDDASRLTLASVDGDLGLFARAPSGLDMIGIEPQFWCVSRDFLETFAYMSQRRSLTVRSNLGVLFWGWIPASTPALVTRNIWGDDTPPAWGTPPVQPTQLRQMTYLSLAAGSRGIAYSGDAELTRSGGLGRALAIEMAFLNFEMDVCERVLAQNEQKLRDYGVFDPEPLLVPSNATQLQNRRPVPVKEQKPRYGMRAWGIPTADRKGVLLLLGDFASLSQFQPPQLAIDEIRVTPSLPEGAQPFEISPGEVTKLDRERVTDGVRITLKEFDTTSLILCTNDLSVFPKLEKLVEGVRPEAVSLAIEQSEILLRAVTEANGRLAADGHEFRSKIDLKRRRQAGIEGAPPDVPDLLAASQKGIDSAREAMERQDYREAWKQARRAQRPLRLVMNGHWEQGFDAFRRAAKKFYSLREGEVEIDEDTDLKPKKKVEIPKVSRRPTLRISPVSCPPLVSFFTLPELYIWADWIKGQPGYRFGRNRIPSGDFDDEQSISESGWVDISYKQDGLIGKVSVVPRAEAPPKSKKEKKKKTIRELDGADTGNVIKLEVKAERPKELDTLQPFLDFPVAAIRSPPIRVERNNLIRISVLVKRMFVSAPGAGGVIVRDSIGGEQFQYRTSDAIPEFEVILLFRKAPADGTFTITLGLAGYGEALFDDLRVEVVEQDDGRAAPDLVRRSEPARRMNSPRAPDPSPPEAAARPGGSRPQPRQWSSHGRTRHTIARTDLARRSRRLIAAMRARPGFRQLVFERARRRAIPGTAPGKRKTGSSRCRQPCRQCRRIRRLRRGERSPRIRPHSATSSSSLFISDSKDLARTFEPPDPTPHLPGKPSAEPHQKSIVFAGKEMNASLSRFVSIFAPGNLIRVDRSSKRRKRSCRGRSRRAHSPLGWRLRRPCQSLRRPASPGYSSRARS